MRKDTIRWVQARLSLYGFFKNLNRLKAPIRRVILGCPGALNYLRISASFIWRTQISWGHPILLTIEPTNICDQKCLVCETGQGILERKPRSMSFEEFQYILDQFDEHLRVLFFYFMGESFLNKDAYRMIRYAADRSIYVSVCTNGNRVNPENLVRSGIAEIQFQIAGTTDEVHSAYRVGGNLHEVLSNLRETVTWRDRLRDQIKNERFPMKIGLGFILFKHNEHQIHEFARIAKDLRVDEYQIIDPCVRTVEQGKKLLPSDRTHWIYDPEAFEKGELRPLNRPNNGCEWVYSTVTIQVNGDVVPCCRDTKGKWVLGNVFREDICDVWNGAKYKALRRAIRTKQRSLPLCRLCEGYAVPCNLPQ